MREKIVFLIILPCLLSLSSVVFAESPIKVIYWKSLDVQMPSQDEIDSLRDVMIEVQSFFASEMDRYGFGEKTFDFKDIEVVEGVLKLHQYTSHWMIQRETPLIERGLDNQIYVVFFGGSGHIGGNNAVSQQLCANIPEQLTYCNNLIVIPTESRHITLPLLAHEIGHAFSLDHPQQRLIANRVDVMYLPLHVIPGITMTLKDFALSQKDAKFLNNSGRLSVQQDSQVLDQEIEIDTDVNNDGVVNIVDLVLVAARYGETITGNPNPNPDVDRSGKVDVNDLVLVATAIDNANSAYSAPAQPLAPTKTALLPNYPNPFNPETWIPYQLSKNSDVTITIYDTQGVIVRRLIIGFQYAGFYANRSRAAYWDGRNEISESVASGMYFYQLQADNVSLLRKMLILK